MVKGNRDMAPALWSLGRKAGPTEMVQNSTETLAAAVSAGKTVC